jgi:hypothetical protein
VRLGPEENAVRLQFGLEVPDSHGHKLVTLAPVADVVLREKPTKRFDLSHHQDSHLHGGVIRVSLNLRVQFNERGV